MITQLLYETSNSGSTHTPIVASANVGKRPHVTTSSEEDERQDSVDEDERKDSVEEDEGQNISEENEGIIGDNETVPDVYSVEYRIASSSEDEDRPDMAGGCGESDDTELDNVADGAVTIMEADSDTAYLGESEMEVDPTVSEDKELCMFDQELLQKDKYKCAECHVPNPPLIRYCGECWKKRKEWVADRPKPKWKSMVSRRNAKSRRTNLPADSSYHVDRRDQVNCSPMHGTADSEELVFETDDDLSMCEFVGSADVTTSDVMPDFAGVAGSSKELNMQALDNSDNVQGIDEVNGPPAPATAEGDTFELKLCILCVSSPRDTCFIHGQIGHQVTCYKCAKKHFMKNSRCPVCRRKIEKIVRIHNV